MKGPVPEFKSIKVDEWKAMDHHGNIPGEVKPIRKKSFGCVNF
jgi:hypothetical protein